MWRKLLTSRQSTLCSSRLGLYNTVSNWSNLASQVLWSDSIGQCKSSLQWREQTAVTRQWARFEKFQSKARGSLRLLYGKTTQVSSTVCFIWRNNRGSKENTGAYWNQKMKTYCKKQVHKFGSSTVNAVSDSVFFLSNSK